MPGNAYFVPTEEASLTATAGRSLQGGLGCAQCNGKARRLSWYLPGVQSPAQLSGWHLPPSLSAFSAAYTYPVDGLGRLGAGAGTGRFNRSVSRGIYELPFIAYPGQGARGLGDFTADPTLLLLGLGALGLSLFLYGRQRPRRHHRRRRVSLA